MLYIQSLREGLQLFKALGSSTRIAVLDLLAEKGPMRMTAIAEALDITGGALTSHVKELHDAGLISIELTGGKHGLQKICHVNDERILVESILRSRKFSAHEREVAVGHYTSTDASAPCGFATADQVNESVSNLSDLPAADRADAGALWFSSGGVEYSVPNALKTGQKPIELQISMEISSFVPGEEDEWPSDIHITVNKKDIGFFTSPGDNKRFVGRNNPVWWRRDRSQHGFFKLIEINEKGSYIDGDEVSDVTIDSLNLGRGDIKLHIYVPPKAVNQGGIMLYGRSFGNYPQDIKVRTLYRG